ncbi:MAG: hypothetical protein MMC33_007654 [Icmadophila ericetorum]|nr:hypothetical protein [Icmadophila ericetorum]
MGDSLLAIRYTNVIDVFEPDLRPIIETFAHLDATFDYQDSKLLFTLTCNWVCPGAQLIGENNRDKKEDDHVTSTDRPSTAICQSIPYVTCITTGGTVEVIRVAKNPNGPPSLTHSKCAAAHGNEATPGPVHTIQLALISNIFTRTNITNVNAGFDLEYSVPEALFLSDNAQGSFLWMFNWDGFEQVKYFRVAVRKAGSIPNGPDLEATDFGTIQHEGLKYVRRCSPLSVVIFAGRVWLFLSCWSTGLVSISCPLPTDAKLPGNESGWTLTSNNVPPIPSAKDKYGQD